ncbi:hypothetical protein YW7DRAFT_05609 [Streptomyces sp. AmelKG-E11A]|nr:hypothetical protein YW7DRAFT_05609 [Streptomyces sp. AmelKG-E11A]
MSDRVGNVSRTRHDELVAEAREPIAQVTKARFALGDKALIIEPMRPLGGSVAKGTDDLFTVEDWRRPDRAAPAARSGCPRDGPGTGHLKSCTWSATHSGKVRAGRPVTSSTVFHTGWSIVAMVA